MIEAKNVSLIYPNGIIGLEGFDLRIQSGEIVYITGPSGSGKTSLLKLILGIEYPTSGELTVLSQPMKKTNEKDIRILRRSLGTIFQEFKLIKGRTALENVMLGMRFLGWPIKTMKEIAKDSLVKVGLEHKMMAYVEHLSWGESQRVAIARAIARNPAIILADEPTGNLDTTNALRILDLLTKVKDKDTTVLITTHATHLIEDQPKGTFMVISDGNIKIEKRSEGSNK
ncbi:MAG: ABC transporter ATP-binding protein [Epulopiscium sp.]|nr:ABC transporter ATP-binding protein [Candidatus Epulonipiscium sp.]